MNGTTVETVASSWMEALGGVSMCWILSTPPGFCAQPACATTTIAAAIATTNPIRAFMLFPPCRTDARPPDTLELQIECTVRPAGALGNLGHVEALRRRQRHADRLDRIEGRRVDASTACEGDRRAHDRIDLHWPA